MVAPTDDEFLALAIRQGHWERFEHPDKGETLTLFLGEFAILSIHAALVDRVVAISRFKRSVGSLEVGAALLARLAAVESQLALAVNALAVNSHPPEAVTEE